MKGKTCVGGSGSGRAFKNGGGGGNFVKASRSEESYCQGVRKEGEESICCPRKKKGKEDVFGEDKSESVIIEGGKEFCDHNSWEGGKFLEYG